MTPFVRIIFVPAVVKAEPSAFVGFKLLEDILPVVILAPSIVVEPLEPTSEASKGVLLVVPSVSVPPLNVTTPLKLVNCTTGE